MSWRWHLSHLAFEANKVDISNWASASDSLCSQRWDTNTLIQSTVQANYPLMMSYAFQEHQFLFIGLRGLLEPISSDVDICSQGRWILPQEHNQASIINPVSPARLPQWHWILVSTPPCCSYHCRPLWTSPETASTSSSYPWDCPSTRLFAHSFKTG